MSPIEKIELALKMARLRKAEYPTLDILPSIIAQLEYMLSVFRGESDKSRMKDIILGLYAVREFEESDPEFANALHGANAIADKMARGLKI
jgi:hypothetical protein